MQRLLVKKSSSHFVRSSSHGRQAERPLLRGEGTIERYKKLPIMYISDLYNHDKITDVEELKSELVDSVIIKIIEEYHSFEAIRACSVFYHNRPNIGKISPSIVTASIIFPNSQHMSKEAGINETYFQNVGAHIKQYRDMLDPVAKLLKISKIFVGSGDKSTSQIRHDLEETLVQYIKTLIQFTKSKQKQPKMMSKTISMVSSVRRSIRFPKLGYEVSPVYKTTLDKLMFKKSGWKSKISRKEIVALLAIKPNICYNVSVVIISYEKIIYLTSLGSSVSPLWPMPIQQKVECTSNPAFKENTCDACYTETYKATETPTGWTGTLTDVTYPRDHAGSDLDEIIYDTDQKNQLSKVLSRSRQNHKTRRSLGKSWDTYLETPWRSQRIRHQKPNENQSDCINQRTRLYQHPREKTNDTIMFVTPLLSEDLILRQM